MKKFLYKYSFLPAGFFFLLLIFDHDAALYGSVEGIQQCLQVIIPSLFPLFFITGWLASRLDGISLPIISHLGKLFSLPKHCETILLMGILGGYPVGAKTIADLYERKTISLSTARILLGYCNNAGPAFIFGICHILFESSWIPWIIWGIQIVSALITGLLLPSPTETANHTETAERISLTSLLNRSISVTAMVCAWILIFRVLLHIISQIPILQPFLPVLAGMLELSNGCMLLSHILPLSLRFVLFSIFLSAGGLCVYLQTSSAISTIGKSLYFPGKCIQTLISTLISIPVACLLFDEMIIKPIVLGGISALSVMLILVIRVISRKICGNYECDDV